MASLWCIRVRMQVRSDARLREDALAAASEMSLGEELCSQCNMHGACLPNHACLCAVLWAGSHCQARRSHWNQTGVWGVVPLQYCWRRMSHSQLTSLSSWRRGAIVGWRLQTMTEFERPQCMAGFTKAYPEPTFVMTSKYVETNTLFEYFGHQWEC